MHLQEIGQRGLIVTFGPLEEWITNIYICFAEKNTYLIDTYCGPDCMTAVKELISKRAGSKPVIVVNTHFHWDHIWGNCAFPEEKILAHKSCRVLADKYWELQITENHQFQMGKVIKRLPNTLIGKKWSDPEDQVEIYHTPGHTIDSISFHDLKDEILFVGDNVEFPLPYVETPDLNQYITTLKHYLTTNCRQIISSHSDYTDKDLIQENIRYIESLKHNTDQHFIDAYAAKVHNLNVNFLRSNALQNKEFDV